MINFKKTFCDKCLSIKTNVFFLKFKNLMNFPVQLGQLFVFIFDVAKLFVFILCIERTNAKQLRFGVSHVVLGT